MYRVSQAGIRIGYLPILFVCVDRWTEDNGKKGVGVAVFLCYAGRLRYVPQTPLRSFCDASGGCVSLRSTARPFAAPLHFAPPEAQARHLSIAIVLYAP